MTAPNHIAGGIVITGILASLWNVNIFANPIFLTTTLIGSLLPDIDHTKSIIGKFVYPLAKYISRRFGHRTITHSFLFLLFITAIVYILEHFHFFNLQNHKLSLILFFAVFSHLLLDMVTVQGIPLFFPFYRNPCVIPAKVEMRITTGNLKQEGIVLFIFAFSILFLQNLFANGFWFNYNKQFNDIEHLERQFKLSNTLLVTDYSYNIFQKQYKGKGYLVYADYQECYILGDTLIHLQKYTQGQVIHKLEAVKEKTNLTLNTANFISINADSINKILYKKFISNGKIYCNQKAYLITNAEPILDNYFEVKNKYNLRLEKNLKDTLNISNIKNVQDVEYKIKLEESALYQQNKNYYYSKKRLIELENKLNSKNLSSYQINEIKTEIIALNKFLNRFTIRTSKTVTKLKKQLKELKNLKPDLTVFFSGSLSYFELPKDTIIQ